MKKYIALFLALALVWTVGAALAETDASGAWYADLNGLSLTLSLNGDGSYTLVLPDGIGESASGAWVLEDGFVRLDNGSVLNVISDSLLLRMNDDLFFSREPVQYYVPADLLSDVPAELYAGYWKCAYVDLGSAVVPADTVDDRTDLYVEGSSAILGGPVFGDTQVKMDFVDGALSCEQDGVKVVLQIQQDSAGREGAKVQTEGILMHVHVLPTVLFQRHLPYRHISQTGQDPTAAAASYICL